jgi:hypothetical protein
VGLRFVALNEVNLEHLDPITLDLSANVRDNAQLGEMNGGSLYLTQFWFKPRRDGVAFVFVIQLTGAPLRLWSGWPLSG